MPSLLLVLLRALVYTKRGLVWLGVRLLGIADRAAWLYRETIGFWWYKARLALRKLARYFFPASSGHPVDKLARRGPLQLIVLVVALCIMWPASKLGATDRGTAGRASLLYSLAGPGEEDFSEEETAVPAGLDHARSWREGAVSRLTAGTGNSAPTRTPEFSSVTMGGTALTKPIILPGTILADHILGAARAQVVAYEVQPGDVVSNIARNFGVQVSTILWANKLTPRSVIRPGDRLKILPVDGVTHKVVRGDTVGKIARLYAAKENDIIAFNKLAEDGSDLAIGEEVMVPNGVARRAVSPAIQVVPRIRALSQIVPPLPSIEAPAGLGFIWPSGVRRITQYFGWRHTGVDIAGPAGTPLYAARAGVVARSQCGWNGGYGCYVIIDHGDGLQTVYGHASDLYVAPGEEVTQGQVVAAMGSTGRSSGPHVHFEVRLSGRKVNPLRYLR